MAKHELEIENEGASNKKLRIDKSKDAPQDESEETVKGFFGLPAELRNDIYRLALVEGEDAILIDRSNHVQPGALRACRQMHKESTSIFTRENTFQYTVSDCTPQIPKSDSDFWLWQIAAKPRPIIIGQANWDNLMRWIEEYYHDERERPPFGRTTSNVTVLLKAFDLAEKLKQCGMDWEDVEECLFVFKEAVRAGIGDVDQAWS